MLKISVEKCLKNVNNKFKLVLIAVKYARHIYYGRIKVSEKDLQNKVTFIALKKLEIKNLK